MNSFTLNGYRLFRFFHCFWLTFFSVHLIIIIPDYINDYLATFRDLSLFQSIFGCLILLTALFSLFNPHKVYLFALAILMFIALKYTSLPRIPNHIFVSLVISLTVLSSMLLLIQQKGSNEEKINSWFQKLLPFIRFKLLIVYFFAVFHKLNLDYFDPAVSCGKVLYLGIASKYTFLSPAPFFITVSIYGTLVLETLIPLGLLFRKTRKYAIIVGLIFHFILSFHPEFYIIVFTTKMFTLLFLYLPTETINHIWTGLQSVFRRSATAISKVLSGALLLYLLIFLSLILFGNPQVGWWQKAQTGRVYFFYLFEFGLMCSIIYALFPLKNPAVSNLFGISKNAAYLFLLNAFLIFNAFSPYMLLKANTDLSMFSNLYVEGSKNNHLFMPSGYVFHTYQQD